MLASMASMPKIDLAKIDLSADEMAIAARILNKGALRASKPKIDYSIGEREMFGVVRKVREPDEIGGKAAYVWRMVAFMLSPMAKHQCMPVCADFDLPENDHAKRRELAKELDKLVDKIVDSVPRNQRHGVNRWARAFGVA